MFRHPMEQKTITILKPDGTTSERPMNRANDLNEAIPADDERGVLDRSASVADDDACAAADVTATAARTRSFIRYMVSSYAVATWVRLSRTTLRSKSLRIPRSHVRHRARAKQARPRRPCSGRGSSPRA